VIIGSFAKEILYVPGIFYSKGSTEPENSMDYMTIIPNISSSRMSSELYELGDVNVIADALQIEIASKLNLSDILEKVAKDNGWTDEFKYKVKEEYMKFLYIIKHYGSGAVPSKMVDLLWHQHILDTKIYMKDMKAIFGRYIHHNPSYTLEQRRETFDKYKIFKQKYFAAFGEMDSDVWNDRINYDPCDQMGDCDCDDIIDRVEAFNYDPCDEMSGCGESIDDESDLLPVAAPNTVGNFTVDALQNEIASKLDLSDILQKVAKTNGWSDEYKNKVSEEYMKFLYIIKYYGHGAVPSKMVDLVWHQHILDTKIYMKDMKAIFGRYIHHNPSYTIKQRQKTSGLYKIFKQKYYAAFGKMPKDVWHNNYDLCDEMGCDDSISIKRECDHDCQNQCNNDDCANECGHDCEHECNDD